ncbi:tail fiber domain-containing protein, partial [bacterium]|nr:tail fiber domain-containing protein [bacterium]
GSYDRLRLVPRSGAGVPCLKGLFYYDETKNQMLICRDEFTSEWATFGGVWTQSVNDIYPADTATNPNIRVGIGTTNPSDGKLVVKSSVKQQIALVLDSATADADDWSTLQFAKGGVISSAIQGLGWTDEMAFWIKPPAVPWNGTHQRMTIVPSGNVGIGTKTPITKLQVLDSALGLDVRIIDDISYPGLPIGLYVYANGTNTMALGGKCTQDPVTRGGFAEYHSSGGNSWGAIGIASTHNNTNTGVHGRLESAMFAADGPAGNLGYKDSSGKLWAGYFYQGNVYMENRLGIGTLAPGHALEVNGDIQADAYFYPSDERLKKDIKRIKNPLDKIRQLNGVTFLWKKDDSPGVGVIAQNLEKVFPELVTTNDSTGFKSIELSNLVAPLIEAVKEQADESHLLREDFNKLNKENLDLRSRIEKLEIKPETKKGGI